MTGAKTAKGLFAAIVALLVLASILRLHPLLRDFDTIPVTFSFTGQAEGSLHQADGSSGEAEGSLNQRAEGSSGSRLDQVLLENLGHLRYTRGFDAVFAAGPRRFLSRQEVWLDRCEVRQGDFGKFSQWRPFFPNLPIGAPNEPAGWRYFSESAQHAISGRLDASASGVTWFDAYAYCRAAGGRLPTTDEWIAAASGPAQRLYPWGDNFNPAPWPYLDPLLNAAQSCDAHPEADTPDGMAGMAHNVSEWAVAADDPLAVRVMGGNAYNKPYELYGVTMLHRRAPASFRSPYLGFRCAYDAEPGATPWRTEADAVRLPPGDYATGIPEAARVPGLVALLPRGEMDLIRRIMAGSDGAGTLNLHVSASETSRREYAVFLRDLFVKAGLYAEESQPKDHRYEPPDWAAQMQEPDLPVVNVDWWSAYAYAAWAGGRLPTAEEWASFSSGQGRWLYPWGNRFREGAAVAAEMRLGHPVAVTKATQDMTSEGIRHLAGNVSEWTRSVSSVSGSYAVIAKGGNYLLPGAKTGRMDFSNHLPPGFRSPTLGFRVVFDRAR